ncbi:MAG: alkaline phosphatase family protein, partial [Actinomycetota bacterium]
MSTVVLLASALLQSPSQATTPVFSDGFETGSLSSWTASSGMTAEQQVVYEGAWAARTTGSGTPAYAYERLATTYPELYLRVEFEVVSNSTPVQLIAMRKRGGGVILSAGINKTGKLLTSSAGTGTTTASSPVSRGSWHELQVHVLINGGGDRQDVWLDGTQVAALSTSASLGTTPIGRISLGQTGKNHVFDLAFDSVLADTVFIPDVDSTAPTQPSGLGAMSVKSHAVALSWDASEDDVAVTGYTVYRSDDEGASYHAIGTSSTTDYTDMSVAPSTSYRYTVDAFDAASNHSTASDPTDADTPTGFSTPIQHVVVIDQENHSFDNVLGGLCADIASAEITGHQACDGATSGTISTGETIPLSSAADLVPAVDHSVVGQQTAVDGGAMDRFDRLKGCTVTAGYACYSRYDPLQGPCGVAGTDTCIPNLAALAENFVISDRTFEFATTPSWGGHMVLGSATLDGFSGLNSKPSTFTSQTGPGWGCDSYKDAQWWDGTQYVLEPSCIPDQAGNGPYRSSPVQYVPTIFDRLDNAGLTWKIYGGSGGPEEKGGWGWTICPTFFECLGSSQRNNLVAASSVITDASAGDLPNYAVVTPTQV